MSKFEGGGAMTTSKHLLQMGLDAVNEEYYFIGDDCHRYALGNIEKELGDLLIEKYPNSINNGAMRIEPIDNFDISQTDIHQPALTFEELWKEHLRFIDEILEKGYINFEEFKKGEGFE